ncbi:uncharacterized protein BT62DRAFT_939253 [Guyanagaster necrorhizus]|uniref:Uncharacterized protein n=1 Tax=Guyanagaster necrorhizus TaxID=856835 RepID=A0A9P8AKX1_9AGAR|nr:uncharacterized protein BT62DRAFT_939253 [Guyanagaster necrorhizus MCA 3950]KAG7439145.1 hypothetical protein BT62DRAFT_939253 [Guyanagaster necrorhizus MCA 3950]
MYPGNSPAVLRLYQIQTAVTDEMLTNVKKRTNRRDTSQPREQNNGLSDSHPFRRRHSQSGLHDIVSCSLDPNYNGIFVLDWQQLTCFKRPLTMFPPPIESCSRQFDMYIDTASDVPGCIRSHAMLFSFSGSKPVSILGNKHTTCRIFPLSLIQTESSRRYQSRSSRRVSSPCPQCSFYIRPCQFPPPLAPLWLMTSTEGGIPHECR